MRKVTSSEILIALSKTHDKDYFLTEVKNGSSYMPPAQGLLRFDAVGITKSYTKPCIKIYEVKVERSDFVRDNKWNCYLQYCNEFYFICPAGLIKKEELPMEVGLIWYNPETKALTTKRKAVYRNATADLTEMYRYIIYSRLDPDRIPFYKDRAEYAKAYLEDKRDKKQVGWNLGSKLARELEEARRQLDNLDGTIKKAQMFNDLVKLLIKKNVIPSYEEYSLITSNRPPRNAEWEEVLKSIEKKLGKVYPDELDDIKASLESSLKRINRVIEKANGKGGNE